MIFGTGFFWMIWVFNGFDYEQWEARLIDEDIEGATATLLPNHKLILFETQNYPFTNEGCDVMKHEVSHVPLMYAGYSSSMHHAIMKVQGNYC